MFRKSSRRRKGDARIMIKEFLKEHPYLRLEIKYINGVWNNCFRIRLYDDRTHNTMYEITVSDTEIENLNVDFETAIMTPIISWYTQQMEEKK